MKNSLEYKRMIATVVSAVLAMSAAANGAVVLASAGDGNVEVDTSGADSYILDGHFVLPSPYQAEILSGVVISGDGGAPLQVVAEGYRVSNHGSILGDGAAAVEVMADIIDEGPGSALRGLYNDGVIASNTHPAIDASFNRVDMRNLGSITSNEPLSVAISLGHLSRVENGFFASTAFGITGASGSITSAGTALSLGEGAVVENSWQSLLQGVAGDGVFAAHGLSVVNDGTIEGGLNGVRTLHDASIENNEDAVISGVDHGVTAADNAFIENAGEVRATGVNGIGLRLGADGRVSNSGEISAASGNSIGVSADELLILQNEENGFIFGTENGVLVNETATIVNHGTIQSTGTAVEELTGGLQLENGGLITGSVGVDSGANNDGLTNSGMITGIGGTAIDMGEGDDGVLLSSGSLVDGSILGGAGDDGITFDGETLTSGDVTGFEQTNKVNTGLSRIQSGVLNTEILNVIEGEMVLGWGLSEATTTTVGSLGSSAELGGRLNFVSANTVIGANGVLSAGGLPLSQANDFLEHFGDTVGVINHVGNLHFEAGSVLRTDTAPIFGVSTDSVDVTGDVVIEPGATVQIGPFDVSRVQQDGDYRALDIEAGGSLTGNFSSAVFMLADGPVNIFESFANGYDVTNTGEFESSTVNLQSVVVDGSVFIRLTHDYGGVPGITPNGKEFGGYLNTLVDDAVGDATLSDFLSFLDYSDADLVASILNSYDPSVHGAFANSVLQHGNMLFNTVRSHRQGFGNRTPVILLKDAKGGVATIEAETDTWSVWAAASFESDEYEGFDLSDLDGDRSSLVLGLDRAVNDRLTVGAAAIVAESEIDGSVSADTDAEMVALYTNYGNALGWQASGLIGYGDYSIDSSRPIFPSTAEATYGADGIVAALNGRYLMDGNGFHWGPTLGLEYRQADVDSFTESGPMGLTVEGRDVESTRLLLGVEASKQFERLRWFGSTRWAYDFSANDQDDIVAGFAGLPGSFAVEAPDQSEHAILLGTGISTRFGKNGTFGVSYFGEVPVSGDGISSHGGSMELKFSF